MFPTSIRDFDFANLSVARQVVDRSQILVNGLLDVLQRLCFGLTLRPAAREAGAGDAVALFGVLDDYLVSHHGLSASGDGTPLAVPNLCENAVAHQRRGGFDVRREHAVLRERGDARADEVVRALHAAA